MFAVSIDHAIDLGRNLTVYATVNFDDSDSVRTSLEVWFFERVIYNP